MIDLRKFASMLKFCCGEQPTVTSCEILHEYIYKIRCDGCGYEVESSDIQDLGQKWFGRWMSSIPPMNVNDLPQECLSR